MAALCRSVEDAKHAGGKCANDSRSGASLDRKPSLAVAIQRGDISAPGLSFDQQLGGSGAREGMAHLAAGLAGFGYVHRYMLSGCAL